MHDDPPAGALGDFMAAAVEGIVKGRVEKALDRMKNLLEED